MEIKHNLTQFPVDAIIKKGDDVIGKVYNIDELEYCVIQALMEKDDSYHVAIGDLDIKLTDPNYFDKIWRKYPACTDYASLTFVVMEILRGGKFSDFDRISTDEFKKYYGLEINYK